MVENEIEKNSDGFKDKINKNKKKFHLTLFGGLVNDAIGFGR